MAAALRQLPRPAELMELNDGESVSFTPISYEKGLMTIHPTYAGSPQEKIIDVLRVHVDPSVKPLPPHYWDITSLTLMAQLFPLFAERDYQNFIYTITAHGYKPRKRFTVRRTPK